MFQVFKKKKLGGTKMDQNRAEVVACEKYVGSFLHGDFFKEVIFSKTMLSDHMPNLYEKSLQMLSGQVGEAGQVGSGDEEEEEAIAKAAVEAMTMEKEEERKTEEVAP